GEVRGQSAENNPSGHHPGGQRSNAANRIVPVYLVPNPHVRYSIRLYSRVRPFTRSQQVGDGGIDVLLYSSYSISGLVRRKVFDQAVRRKANYYCRLYSERSIHSGHPFYPFLVAANRNPMYSRVW